MRRKALRFSALRGLITSMIHMQLSTTLGITRMGLSSLVSTLVMSALALGIASNARAENRSSLGANSHELLPLIFLFAFPKSSLGTVQDWSIGARKRDRIDWITDGVAWTDDMEGTRIGTTIVTMNGKPLYVLKKHLELAPWTILLRGAHAGVYEVRVSSPTSRDLSPIDLPAMLRKMKVAYSIVACDELGGASSGTRIYEVEAPKKKKAWLLYEWSCGSGGCGVETALYFQKPTEIEFGPGIVFSENCPMAQ